jgi:hypothetical protein
MTFQDLEFKDLSAMNGVQAIVKFENNYGASIVRHKGSYGGKQGLYELAVIKFNEDEEWGIVYDPRITPDVLGYLTKDNVTTHLKQIEQLVDHKGLALWS